MANYDFNYDFKGENSDSDSDSDNNDALLADIQALSRPASLSSPGNQSDDVIAPRNPSAPTTALNSSDSEDDFEVLRDIQHKYGSGDGADSKRGLSPRSIIRLRSVNSDSDDDNDFEMLRAIERRFGQYSTVGTNADGNRKSKDMRGNYVVNSSVEETLNNAISDRTDSKEVVFCDYTAYVESPDDDVEKRHSLSSELPKSALAFVDAIKKNRAAQKYLRNKMLYVEARMEEVKKMIRKVKVIYEFDVRGRKKIGRRRQDDRVQLISVPNNDKRVSAAMRHGPQENLRVANYRISFKQYPQWILKTRWTEEERRNLKKGVVQQFQKCLLMKSMDRINESERSEYSDAVDGIISMIGEVEVNPQTMKSFLPNIDWDELASTYLPRRSGRECQARWINYEDPMINLENWAHLEDKSLLLYVQQKGLNWVAVAESLGTNRTPYQCFARYQRSLNPCLIKREWTAAEDAELTTAVQTYGESNWTVVASALEGRTGPQCSNRWLKTLLPSKQRKGRWELHEDKRLKIAVMLMGCKCWNKIAEFVPGRTQASCRDRWVNCLDPSLNLGKWTEEEDRKLEEGISIHGYSWAKVASCVPPRTDNQCRRRWMVLFPDEVIQLQAARKLTRVALPSNFVDREPNRPTLGAYDFVPLALGDADNSRKREKKSTRKLYKVSDAAFCNIPKRPRSARRCRRWVGPFEIPMIHNHGSFGILNESDTLQSKRRRAKGSRIKQNKHVEADLTLADLEISAKGAHKKRKRELNGSLADQSKQSEPVEGQKSCTITEDKDPGSVCTTNRIKEEHQEDSSLGALGSVESGNSSGNIVACNFGYEAVACRSKITEKHSKKLRLNLVESEECGDLTLADLFGRAALHKIRMKG